MVEKLLTVLCKHISAIAFVGLVLLFASLSARADSVVNLCHLDNEGGAGMNLENALKIGGRITFSCGGLVNITITKTHLIDKNIEIDGANVVTLDAEGRQLTMFRVLSSAATFSLNRLIARNARSPSIVSDPDALVSRGSVVATPPLNPFAPLRRISGVAGSVNVTLESVEISGNESPLTLGNVDSTVSVTIRHSQFRNNTGAAASFICKGQIDQDSFVGNEIALYLGNGGNALITSSQFTQNTVNAINVGSGSTIDLRYSYFQGNKGQTGSGMLIDGSSYGVSLRNVDFSNNEAVDSGGAIAITYGTVRIGMQYVNFVQNKAGRGGAISAAMGPNSSLTVAGGLFDGNSAIREGGGLAGEIGKILVSGAIFKNNSAAGGSALFMIAAVDRPFRFSNVLIADNKGPGAAIVGINLELRNTTVVQNQGGGILALTLPLTHTTLTGVTLRNSILSRNTPTNCSGNVAHINFQTMNIQFPADPGCTGALNVEPLLDSIYAPLPGSPAYGKGDLETCMNFPVGGRDLFFQTRGVKGTCSIGAYENAPEQFMKWRAWKESQRPKQDHNPNSRPKK